MLMSSERHLAGPGHVARPGLHRLIVVPPEASIACHHACVLKAALSFAGRPQAPESLHRGPACGGAASHLSRLPGQGGCKPSSLGSDACGLGAAPLTELATLETVACRPHRPGSGWTGAAPVHPVPFTAEFLPGAPGGLGWSCWEGRACRAPRGLAGREVQTLRSLPSEDPEPHLGPHVTGLLAG